MKKIIITLFFCGSLSYLPAQTKTAITLKSVLLEQLKTTHNKKDWFVPVNIAVEGLTAEQAMMKDSSGNHSVAQLVSHLIFWNGRLVSQFKGEKPDKFNGNNDETFAKVDKQSWAIAVKKLDEILSEMEKIVSEASDEKLAELAPTIANVSTHNAYHTGQIIFVRKLHGNWDPEKGVK